MALLGRHPHDQRQHDDDVQGAQQAAGRLPKPLTIAAVWENTDHGKDYIDAVSDAAKAHPDLFRIVLNQSFQLNGSDFSQTAKRSPEPRTFV